MIRNLIHVGILALFVVLVGMTVTLAAVQEEDVHSVPTPVNVTVLVAASDSLEASKAQADYVCDGVADQIEIQRALNALGTRGGTVSLTEGTFHLSGDLNIPSDTVFEGQGPDATWLEWSSGRVKCEKRENIVLRNFKTTGTGSIFIFNCDHVKVHSITATVDTSFDGGAFYLYACYDIIEDIEFVNCKAVNCGRPGWQNCGEGSPKTIRDVRYIDCEAIDCGRYSRRDPYGQWTCGFILAENADIEDIEVVRCYAEGSFESGFHFEAAPSKKRIVLRDCVSKSNGQKPGDYYNPDTETYGCMFGSGFWLHGDVTLINCTAENNRKCGYAVWSPSSDINPYDDTGTFVGAERSLDCTSSTVSSPEAAYGVQFDLGSRAQGGTTLYNCISNGNGGAGFSSMDSNVHFCKCTDDGSAVGFWLFETHDIFLEDCASLNAGAYAVYALEASGVTVENLHMVNPTGVNGNSTFFGTAAHPVLSSWFDIFGKNSADVRPIYGEGGQDITFSGVIRTDHPEPVVIRGGRDIDTSRLQILAGVKDDC